MKIKYIPTLLLSLLALAPITSCEDYLEEENRNLLSDEVVLSDPTSFDRLVASVYDRMRTATTVHELEFVGTDIFTRGDEIVGTNDLNDYVNLTPSNGVLYPYWSNYYRVIAAANTVLDRADQIIGLADDVKTRGLAEARFLRAYAYFHLVEHFGGVPLVLNEIKDPRTSFTRATEEEVYSQLLEDLNAALAGVDENPAQYGRVSKDAVRHLKAKVLLTRGYKSFGTSADFTEAAELAETVIARHPLVANYGSLFTEEGQRNSEVIFAMLYGDDPVARGYGNNRHLLFKFEYDKYPGLTRSTLYHRGLGAAPTPYFFTLFAEEDEREEATIRRVIYAEVDASDSPISAGDTAIFFPRTSWTEQQKTSKEYTVFNFDEYFENDGTTVVHYPMFKKFDDPGVPYTNPGIDPVGERDAYIFRSGGTHLLAAEAYFKANNNEMAAEHLNAVRTRAGLSDMIAPEEIDIQLILEERARELAGEESRWMDLKRTGTLIERVLAYNPHAALNQAINTRHLLRPIPQSEVEVTGIAQNDY